MDIRRVNNPDGSVTLTDTDYPGQRVYIAPNRQTFATQPESGASIYSSDVGRKTLRELDSLHAVATGSAITYPNTNLHSHTWVGQQSFSSGPTSNPGTLSLDPRDWPPQENGPRHR